MGPPQIILAAPALLLECLDFNKKALLFHFENLHPMIKPDNITSLNPLDGQSVEQWEQPGLAGDLAGGKVPP